MKKFRILLLSVFAVVLGLFLVACEDAPVHQHTYALHEAVEPTCEETGWEFTKVYVCRAEMRFNPPSDEVASLDWVGIKDFEADFKANPRKYTPSFLKVYEFFKSKCDVLD